MRTQPAWSVCGRTCPGARNGRSGDADFGFAGRRTRKHQTGWWHPAASLIAIGVMPGMSRYVTSVTFAQA
jgi:hypothetical protein